MTNPFGASAVVSASASASFGAALPARAPSSSSAPTTTPPAFTYPYQTFRFHVHFEPDPLFKGEDSSSTDPQADGAFSECTGLEATMEVKVIKEGGRNFGAAQRAGPVTFATVVLKRGVTSATDLWRWFDLLTQQKKYQQRMAATINVYDHSGKAVMAWRLAHAIPVKFKGADLNARGSEVGVEELHLAHEGLTLVAPSHPTIDSVPQPR
jgi:phage tail-like protein